MTEGTNRTEWGRLGPIQREIMRQEYRFKKRMDLLNLQEVTTHQYPFYITANFLCYLERSVGPLFPQVYKCHRRIEC